MRSRNLKSLAISIAVACLLILASQVFSERAKKETCDCDISEEKVEEYNALLELDAEQKKKSEADNLMAGLPVSSDPDAASGERYLYQRYYIIGL